jgi:Uma2 family endonuclease
MKLSCKRLVDMPTPLDGNGLLAAWRRLTATEEFWNRHWCELDVYGGVLMNAYPSARRQIVITDVYCQLTDQIGHLAAMSVAVSTRSFGIRVPDVVWMPSEKWESFDRDDPVPFVPDLCVEVLLDTNRAQDIDRRVEAYLEGGAREVIVVDQRGSVELWGESGQRQASLFGIKLSLDVVYLEEDGMMSPVSVVERLSIA